MPNDSLLPGQHGELVSQDLRPTRWWYAWFQRVNARVLSAETTAQAASDAVAAIPASEAVTITEGPGIDVYGEHPSFRVEVKPDVLANLGRQGVPGRDGEDGQDSYVPGPKGDKGDTGASGQTIIIREEHYEESWPVVPQAAASASGSSTPTGTGFPHITAGAQDAAAKLVDTADVNANQITNAKLAQMAAHTIKANITGSTADPVDSSLSAILDAEISSTQGVLMYRNASGWVALSPGTSGYLLSSNGAGANPSYIAPGAASVGAGSVIGYAYTQSTTTASTTDTSIPADNTIPQSGEGVAYASLDTTYTPQASSSLLEIDVRVPLVGGLNARFALFRDSGANALAAVFKATQGTVNDAGDVNFRVIVSAGSTSATTFKLRWCTGSGTSYILQITGSTFFSTSGFASMTVREIKQ